jgi:Mg-chelatase subunit ChlD
MKTVSTIFLLVSMFILTQVHPGFGQDEKKNEETSPQQVEVQQQNPPLDIILVLDNSGSMKKNDPEFLTREVVRNFVAGLGENSRLGMVIFGQEAELAEPLTELTNTEAKAGFLESLAKVNYKGQFTNSPAGIERAIYELKTNAGPDAQKVIIFLTDGIVDTGDKDQDIEKEKWLKEYLAQESKLEGIRIFGVAFTDKADFRLIQTLALKTGGEYFRAYKAEDIEGVFKDIHALISKPPVQPETPAPQMQAETPKPETPQQASPAPASAAVPPIVEKKGISPVVILAGIVVLVGILILFLIFRGKSKKPDAVMRPDTPAPREEAAMPRAELIDDKKVVSDQPLELGKRSVKIGRDQTNDIIIAQDTVSSLHAIIEFKEGYFYIEDQRSSNGTRLNNQKIEPDKSLRLKSGDRLKFDVFEFTFSIPGQAQAGKTVLSGKGAAPPPKGTTLRTSKPPEDPAPAQPGSIPGDENEKPLSEPAPKEPAPPVQESKTRLKPGMCPNHASLKATELCPVCKNAFCQKCMVHLAGKDMCINCAREIDIDMKNVTL